MRANVLSGALQGVHAFLVEVEVDLISSLPFFSTVGLAEGAVKESKERVRSAIKNSKFQFPLKRITVNLAPAGIPKAGTSYDLPIAVGILLENGDISPERLSKYLLVGELSLDGRLRPIKGALPIACMAAKEGFDGLILPEANAQEAAVVGGLKVLPANTLGQVVDFLNFRQSIEPCQIVVEDLFRLAGDYPTDFSDVRGQPHVKRALEVAAAGGHNVLMIGPPGSGKTMLAKRLPSILPRLSFEEALETTQIYSVSGLVPKDRPLITHRPFRAPHHTISEAGLIGGGSYPVPGEISLSHNGVLFLDEMPEFRRQALEVMRQPLEDGHVTLSRARWTLTYPARVMLVATMNPCPCGHLGDSKRHCACSTNDVIRYRSRLSGPLLDRIDIHCEVPALRYQDLSAPSAGAQSAAMKARVEQARTVQRARYLDITSGEASSSVHCNAQLSTRLLHRVCSLSDDAQRLLGLAIDRLGLSARAYSRVLKVSRTIADLDGAESVESKHVAEAIQYRSLDRSLEPKRQQEAAS